MFDRKDKRGSENLVELNPEDSSFVLEPAQVEVGSGYTVQVDYDEHEKPIIDVKTYGTVDVSKLRREIERMFPNAQIRQLGQKPSVTIVKTSVKKRRKKKK